jgi:hypothetical protein
MRSLVAARVAVAVAVVVVVMGVAATADAHAVRYRSRHPLPRKIGHGFCYIDAPHVHDFGPSDPRLYREVNGEYYFVGDPAPFDYEGPRFSFYGPHPVVEADAPLGQPIYCYLNGPHYHWYQPTAAAQFEFRGGAYWYVGNYDPIYYQDRPRNVAVNEVYQPLAYARPIVDVTVAPPSFHGEIVVGPGYQRAQVGAGPPVVSAGVSVGVAVPPPPQIQVGVGIGFGVGGPPVVVQERREVYEVAPRRYDDRHYDNGHHTGWVRNERAGHDHGWRGAPAPQPQPPRGGGWRPAPPAAAAPAPHGGGWRAGPAPAPAPHGASPASNGKHQPHNGGWPGR